MLTIERHEWIRRKLYAGQSVALEALAGELGISMATAYRDIAALEAQGVLTLSRGVVRAAQLPVGAGRMLDGAALSMHQSSELRQLDGIAEAAAQSITANDSLFIGEGLVCYLLAQKIRKQPRLEHLIVVTNNFGVAVTLHGHVRHLYLIGGELLRGADNIYTGGSRMTSNLSTLSVNQAFASVDGIDMQVGYTMRELSQISILSKLPSFTSGTVFLAPSCRFGNRSVHHLAPLDFVDAIITDGEIAPDVRQAYEALGRPRLIVAEQ